MSLVSLVLDGNGIIIQTQRLVLLASEQSMQAEGQSLPRLVCSKISARECDGLQLTSTYTQTNWM